VPDLTLVKSASAALSEPPVVGDIVTFTYKVTNTGNTTLFNVDVTETAAEFSGTGTLPSPVFVAGGSNEDSGAGTADLLPDASMTFSATYAITSDDIIAGAIENDTTNDPTVVNLFSAPVANDDSVSDIAVGAVATLPTITGNDTVSRAIQHRSLIRCVTMMALCPMPPRCALIMFKRLLCLW